MKLSELNSPALAGVIREKTKASAIAEIKNCLYNGAKMIDLHMSCLEDTDEETLRSIITSTRLPVLALNYKNYYDWSEKAYTEEEREELFVRAVKAGATGVDIQGYTFDAKSKNGFFGEDKYSFTKGNPKEIVTDEKTISRQCEFIEKIHSMGAEVLLSCHPNVVMNSTQIVDLALFLEKRNPDIIKIVTVCDTEEDLLEGFKAMSIMKKEIKTKVSFHTNGYKTALSRIINPMLGGHIIFCNDHYSPSSTFDQLHLKTVKTIMDNIEKLM